MSWLINYMASPTVLGYLKSALDNFIDGIDSNKFEMDFRSGTIDLEDLRVKPKVITDLGILPKGCTLAWSHVGRIHAEIKSYTSKEPIVVEIHDVELVFINNKPVGMRKSEESNDDNDDNPLAAFAATSESAWDLKKRGVDVAWSAFEYSDDNNGVSSTGGGRASETRDSVSSNDDGSKSSNRNSSTTSTITSSVRGVWKNLDNLQIEIRNLHIRYEDTVTTSEATGGADDTPFSGGVYMESLALFSTNAQGEPIYVNDSDAKGMC
jgi:hypothetical protein